MENANLSKSDLIYRMERLSPDNKIHDPITDKDYTLFEFLSKDSKGRSSLAARRSELTLNQIYSSVISSLENNQA